VAYPPRRTRHRRPPVIRGRSRLKNQLPCPSSPSRGHAAPRRAPARPWRHPHRGYTEPTRFLSIKIPPASGHAIRSQDPPAAGRWHGFRGRYRPELWKAAATDRTRPHLPDAPRVASAARLGGTTWPAVGGSVRCGQAARPVCRPRQCRAQAETGRAPDHRNPGRALAGCRGRAGKSRAAVLSAAARAVSGSTLV
jgi:hypothetical protein